MLTVRMIGEGITARLALCDANGVVLPGQRAVELKQPFNRSDDGTDWLKVEKAGAPTITVEFVINGRDIVLVPSG